MKSRVMLIDEIVATSEKSYGEKRKAILEFALSGCQDMILVELAKILNIDLKVSSAVAS